MKTVVPTVFLKQFLYNFIASVKMYLFFFSKMFPFRLLQNIEQNFSGGSVVKNLPAMQEMQVQSLGQEDPLEKCMATHSSILAWRIP